MSEISVWIFTTKDDGYGDSENISVIVGWLNMTGSVEAQSSYGLAYLMMDTRIFM